jgi:hypothetical protein
MLLRSVTLYGTFFDNKRNTMLHAFSFISFSTTDLYLQSVVETSERLQNMRILSWSTHF